MPWCEKHNREQLKSKFGENQWWCPDCAKEKKTTKPPGESDKQHEETMDALRKLYKKIDDLEKGFKAFTQIFSRKD